ncbi:hypothetical protein BC939DRAFT_498114 [Gamsiella multidivaricata]|uniref:uncharacterized protein n=1 Tax=Gamsiella multidivaricata TaxID=101098 RepID=UPI00221F7C0F|nr:uncharacterized protein BC939DRAFT_498114 [Gamsiella multidivaricata]KAI7832715.1 hypothetical protein BC939DRAFT_498114 [Gamsiella multidivaricata]
MKSTTLANSVLAVAVTLFSILFTTTAHIAISNPPAQAGPWSQSPRSDVHAWIGFEGKPFPCGGYRKGPVTTYQAGQVINVTFWNFQVKDSTVFPPPAGVPQARHGGGACEFSLSYNAGKTWHVIGQYTKTCPDLYYRWPVLVPSNVPSCTDSDRCLFAMSWTAFSTNQFYHHCANVIIEGKDQGGALPPLQMTIVDVQQLGQQLDTHADGDKLSTTSTGPQSDELEQNLSGYFAAGGGAGTSGLNLGLIRSKPKATPDND